MSFDPVAFDKIEVAKRMCSRLLLQFHHAPVLIDILTIFASEIQVLLDASEGVVVDRSPLDAVVEQLEGLGRIVGQKRIVVDQEDFTWFTPDTAGFTIDVAPAWVTGVPTSGSLLADDTVYRQLIEAKIFRNFAQYGSVLENQQVALLAFGVRVSYQLIGPMAVDIILSPNASPTVVKLLMRTSVDSKGDGAIMPYPPTLKINSVLFAPDGAFAPDTPNTVDVAPAAVKYFV